MSARKLRIHRTEAESLIANLRGEIGELITTWMLLRHFMSEINSLRTEDPAKDITNQSLSFTSILTEKLRDELAARLSELAEEKVGRLNFFFAATKLDILHDEAKMFGRLVVKRRIREKRNQDISHKELPETWNEAKYLYIDYRVLLRVLATAVRLMKKLDRAFLGPAAPYFWAAVRKKRYESLMAPPRAGYLLLPYTNLPRQTRLKLVVEEILEQKVDALTPMETSINGSPAKILVSRRWGVIHLGDRLLALDKYPLQGLQSLNFLGDARDADQSS